MFDVDGCLIDSLTGTSLRPGTEQLLTHLRKSGRSALLWSAGGAEYAERRAGEQAISHLFASFHGKVDRDGDGRYIPTFLDDVQGAVFVDDRPEDIPRCAQVIAVSPYLARSVHDKGLRAACEVAGCEWPSVLVASDLAVERG